MSGAPFANKTANPGDGTAIRHNGLFQHVFPPMIRIWWSLTSMRSTGGDVAVSAESHVACRIV